MAVRLPPWWLAPKRSSLPDKELQSARARLCRGVPREWNATIRNTFMPVALDFPSATCLRCGDREFVINLPEMRGNKQVNDPIGRCLPCFQNGRPAEVAIGTTPIHAKQCSLKCRYQPGVPDLPAHTDGVVTATDPLAARLRLAGRPARCARHKALTSQTAVAPHWVDRWRGWFKDLRTMAARPAGMWRRQDAASSRRGVRLVRRSDWLRSCGQRYTWWR